MASRGTPATEAQMVERFATDISRAINLRQMLYQRKIDREFIDGGGRICYALDSNILHSFFRDDIGITPQDLQAFIGPDEAPINVTEQRTSDILVSYLVQQISRRDQSFSPLIVLPGHVEEVRTLHTRLVERFAARQKGQEGGRSRLDEISRKIAGAPVQEQARLLAANEKELHALIYEIKGAEERLNRFNFLMSNNRLRGWSKLRFDPNWLELMNADDDLASLLAKPDDETLSDWGEGSPGWWESRLDEMPEQYVKRDKIALAMINRLNTTLFKFNARLVLFTDNEHIRRVGHRYNPFRYSSDVWGRYTFSDLFIRHPRALLFEPELLQPDKKAEQVYDTGWLDAFLSRVVGVDGASDLISFRAHANVKVNVHVSDYTNEAKTALSSHPTSHDEFFEQWMAHLGNITSAHVSTSSLAKESVDLRRRGSGGTMLSDLPALVDEMSALTRKSWDSFYIIAAKSGYEMISLSSEKVRGQKRNVPILFLRDATPDEDALKMINDTNGVIRNETEIKGLLEKLDGVSSRRARYISALCYSLLFAYADRWAVARALSKRAVELGKTDLSTWNSSETQPDHVSGREALYLACVTHRLAARSIDDLKICSDYLLQAQHALEVDNEDSVVGSVTFPPMTGIRFATEEIAISTAKMLFQAFDKGWDLTQDKQLACEARKLIENIINHLVESASCQDELIQRSCNLNLRTFFFTNLFLLECSGKLVERDVMPLPQLIIEQLTDWRRLSSDEELGDVSAIDLQSLIYAGSLLSIMDGSPAVLNAQMSVPVPPLGLAEQRFLMPYDRSRYNKMATLARARKET